MVTRSFFSAGTCMLLATGIVTAQDKQNVGHIGYYIALYTTGPSWERGKAAPEQAHFAAHSAHLSGLRKVRRIIMGARYADTGMIVLRASSELEAREWLETDPAIQNKLFQVEVFEMSPFYGGCLE